MKNLVKIFPILLGIAWFNTSYSQCFQELNIRTEGTAFGKAHWGDCDNDGDLDIIINGIRKDNSKSANIYLNIGGLLFPELPLNLPGVFRGYAVWADINNDGWNDFIYCGLDNDFKSRTIIYLNNKDNNFSYYKELDGLINGKIVVSDINSDTKNDIILIGRTNSGRETLLYLSDGNNGFVRKKLDTESLRFPAIALFNYNGDSLPDLMICGKNSLFKRVTKIYTNKNNGNFELSAIQLPGFSQASVSAFDYDHNGYEDLLISGNTGKGVKTKLFSNTKGALTESSAIFPGIYRGENSFIDYNNDGHQDILLSGYNEKPMTKLYINDGKNNFTELKQNFEGMYDASISVGDYDKDSDQDFMINGRTADNNYLLIIYKNLFSNENK